MSYISHTVTDLELSNYFFEYMRDTGGNLFSANISYIYTDVIEEDEHACSNEVALRAYENDESYCLYSACIGKELVRWMMFGVTQPLGLSQYLRK